MSRHRLLAIASGAMLAITAVAMPARAQNFPTKPITLIVPFPAGGATDRHLRVLADIASRHLGQPIVIDNKAGATGTLGPATMAGAD